MLVVSVFPRFIVNPNPALPVQIGGGDGDGGHGQVAAGGCCASAAGGPMAATTTAPAIVITLGTFSCNSLRMLNARPPSHSGDVAAVQLRVPQIDTAFFRRSTT
jgi:hypothetical protein